MNYKFKVGDKVKYIGDGIYNFSGNAGIARMGDIFTISARGVSDFDGEILYSVEGAYEIRPNWNSMEKNFELVTNNKNNMSLKEKFAGLMKGEPEKSFFKAGITNMDYSLTDEGSGIFLEWLLKKHGVEFKSEVVDKLIDNKEE